MPIDRVERPDSSHYRVDASPDARDEKRRQREGEEEENKDKFEKGVRWSKVLGADGITRRKVQMETEKIQNLTFKNLRLQTGIFTLEADLHTKDGKIHKGVQIQLPERIARERLKGMKPGQMLATDILSLGQFLNVILPMESSISPLDPRWAREIAGPNRWDKIKKSRIITALGFFAENGDPRWGIIITYMLALSIVAFAMGAMIQVIR